MSHQHLTHSAPTCVAHAVPREPRWDIWERGLGFLRWPHAPSDPNRRSAFVGKETRWAPAGLPSLCLRVSLKKRLIFNETVAPQTLS